MGNEHDTLAPATRSVAVCENGLPLRRGGRLGPITVAYQHYGRLSRSRDNVILVCHALSGGAHAAGLDRDTGKAGWWNGMIGPGKPFDTRRFFVVASNVLGGCYGTTGPSSIDASIGQPFGSRFPRVTIADMVEVQRRLLDRLGVRRLAAVAGGSMGGMQALQWAVSYPEQVDAVIAIASTSAHSPQQIALNHVARRTLMADPAWRGGDYYGTPGPRAGLAAARMLGHVTYLCDGSMQRKFGRRSRRLTDAFGSAAEFEVEHYLDHQGASFVDRFDPNSFLAITRALDDFNLAEGFPSLGDVFRSTSAKLLALTFSSDWLYPPDQLERVAEAASRAGRHVAYHEVQSDHGHDAFLIDVGEQARFIAAFLAEPQLARHPGQRVDAPAARVDRPQTRSA
jgi:homoserine O-acetyltransferase